MTRNTLGGAVIALALLTAIPGCQRGPQLGKVRGKVTFNGAPVPFAYVKFQPQKPRGTYGSAYTDAAGVYSLQFSRSRHGALVGQHSVSIRTSRREEMEVEDKSTGLMKAPPLPDGYRENLQVEFEREVRSGRNQHDFELSPK